MSDSIKISGNWDFDNKKEIAKDDYSYGSINFDSKKRIWKDKDTDRKIYDGINADEAEYIVTEFENLGVLGDGEIDDKDLDKFLDSHGWNGDDKRREGAKKDLNSIVSAIANTYQNEETKPALNTQKPGLTKKDDNTYEVQVQTWGSSAIDGNDYANDCLDRIMRNYYSEVTPYSDEWNKLQEEIMNLNTNIYGTNAENLVRNTLDGQRMNSTLYDTDKVILPANIGSAKERSQKNNDEIAKYVNGLDADKYDIDAINKLIENNPKLTLDELKKEIEKGDYKKEDEEAEKQAKLEQERNTYINGLDSETYDIDLIKNYVKNNPDITLDELKKEIEKGDYKKEELKNNNASIADTKEILSDTSIYNDAYKYETLAKQFAEKSSNEIIKFLNDWSAQNPDNSNLYKYIMSSFVEPTTIQMSGGGHTYDVSGYKFTDDDDKNKQAIRNALSNVASDPDYTDKLTEWLNKNSTDTYKVLGMNRTAYSAFGTASAFDIINLQSTKGFFDDSNFSEFAKTYKGITSDKLVSGSTSAEDVRSCFQTYEQVNEMFDEFEELYKIVFNSESKDLYSMLDYKDSNYSDTNNVSLSGDYGWLKQNGRNKQTDMALKVYRSHIQQITDYITKFGTTADKQKLIKVLEKYN